jgi:hypothetical protein
MRERDLKALEFDKVMALVMTMAASEPAREGMLAARLLVRHRAKPALFTRSSK